MFETCPKPCVVIYCDACKQPYDDESIHHFESTTDAADRAVDADWWVDAEHAWCEGCRTNEDLEHEHRFEDGNCLICWIDEEEAAELGTQNAEPGTPS